jgi:hypothetical protein
MCVPHRRRRGRSEDFKLSGEQRCFEQRFGASSGDSTGLNMSPREGALSHLTLLALLRRLLLSFRK